MRPRFIATATAAARSDTPSFPYTFARCVLIVVWLRYSRLPISGVEQPWATRPRTSRSLNPYLRRDQTVESRRDDGVSLSRGDERFAERGGVGVLGQVSRSTGGEGREYRRRVPLVGKNDYVRRGVVEATLTRIRR